MPLSEFLKMTRGKLESSQPKTDVSFRSENDLVELVWENGQIVMQGQSGRATRSPTCNSNASRVRDSEVGHGTSPRFGKFESILNDVAPVVPSGEFDLSQDDEMAPWFNYPIDDTIGRDYVSEFIPEMSGVTGNGMSNRSSFVSVDKRNGCGGTTLKTSPSSKDHPLCLLPRQHHQGSEALGSGVSDIVSNNTCNNQDATFGRQNIRPPAASGSNFLNFSHFSRPANLVKPKDIELHGSSAGLPKASSQEPVVNTPKEVAPLERTENLSLDASSKNDKAAMLGKTDNLRKGVPDGERIVEPMVASSSVGSGNSADRISCDQTHYSKRKFHDIDESDCRSDDVDTESLDTKKQSHVRGSKRGRAAEVHNLSERRRRDRINEKMRALQELIPNCNNADKASMLDEAIEYLKTLQLQVQFMSMGAGLCMPTMMFPTGMQHMHPAHVPHFPPMGVGMGTGMGFGMVMMDMSGASSGYHMYPVPSMHVSHFRPPVSGTPNYQRIPIPMFGHPGQGLQNSVPRPPFAPVASAMGMNGSRNGNSSEVANTSSIVNPMNSESICNAEASCSMNENSNQATTEVLAQSAALQDSKQGTNAMGPAALSSSATTTGIIKEPAEHNKSPLT